MSDAINDKRSEIPVLATGEVCHIPDLDDEDQLSAATASQLIKVRT